MFIYLNYQKKALEMFKTRTRSNCIVNTDILHSIYNLSLNRQLTFATGECVILVCIAIISYIYSSDKFIFRMSRGFQITWTF